MTYNITVKKIKVAGAIYKGVEAWEKENGIGAGRSAASLVKARWAVNYIRHELSNYDAQLAKFAPRASAQHDAVALLIAKEFVDACTALYPELKAAAEAFLAQKESVL